MKKSASGSATVRSQRKQRLSLPELESAAKEVESAIGQIEAAIAAMREAKIVSVAFDGVGKAARGAQLVREFAAGIRVGIAQEGR